MSALITSNQKWDELVNSSKGEIETFNDFASDKAIVWADKQIKSYKQALMALVYSNSNWPMNVTDEQEKLINTMIRRIEGGE